MAKKGGGKKSTSLVGKIIIAIALIVIILGLGYYAIVDGIRNKITDVIFTAVNFFTDGGFSEFVRDATNLIFFWQYSAPDDEGIYIYKINNDDINGPGDRGIRTGLIGQSIQMDKIGLDSTIIKEMNVVYNASKSTKDTLIIAELGKVYKTEGGEKVEGNDDKGDGYEEREGYYIDDKGQVCELDSTDGKYYVLEDDEVLKVTDPEKYTRVYDLKEEEKNKIIKKYKDNIYENSKKIGDKYYTAHYLETDVTKKDHICKIFWFEVTGGDFDSTDEEGNNIDNNGVYLGALGVIKLVDEDGNEFTYRSASTIDTMKDDLENGLVNKDQVVDKILHSYTIDENGRIIIYDKSTMQSTYISSIDGVEEEAEGEEVIRITDRTIDLEDLLDYSRIAIPIELSSDFLDITGSNEFADVFMDFALSRTEIIIAIYRDDTTEVSYNTTRYYIDAGAKLEVYDFGSVENYNKYKDIVENRTYNGEEVTDIVAFAEEKFNEAKDQVENLEDDITEQEGKINNLRSQIALYEGLIADLNRQISNISIRISELTAQGNKQAEIDALTAERTALINTRISYQNQINSWNSQINNVEQPKLDDLNEQLSDAEDNKTFFEDLKNAIQLSNGEGTTEQIEVMETIVTTYTTQNGRPIVKKISTWYEDVEYNDPTLVTEIENYSHGERSEDTSDNFGENYEYMDQVAEERGDMNGENINKAKGYSEGGVTSSDIWDDLYGEDLEAILAPELPDELIEHENDDSATKARKSEERKAWYEERIEKLIQEKIAENSTKYGNYKNSSDFVYSDYSISDANLYTGRRVNSSTYQDNNTRIDTGGRTNQRIGEFLTLLKNEKGDLSVFLESNKDNYFKEYESGKLVEYDDIYLNKAIVGSLLENGEDTMEQLLNDSTNTQGLVDVFKNIMEKYRTGYFTYEDDPTAEDFVFARDGRNTMSGSGDELLDYIMAWENSFIYEALVKGESNSYASNYYTVEDGVEYYIVYYEARSDTWNFSYGINIGSSKDDEHGGGDYYDSFLRNGLEPPSHYRHTGAKAEREKIDNVYKEDLQKIKASVISTVNSAGANLTNQQIDALVSIKYQYGNIAGFKEAYTAAGGDVTSETFKNSFWVYTGSGGKAYPFTTSIYGGREQANWKLMTEGMYTDSNGDIIATNSSSGGGGSATSLRGGTIMETAEKVHTYMEQHYYTYGHENGGTPAGMKSQRTVNCISFVTWVYYEAGLIDRIYTSCGDFQDSGVYGRYKGKFVKINNYEDLEPGDIMYFGDHDHAEIYAGDGYSYNAGTTAAIQRDEPTYKGRYRGSLSFAYGYRYVK